MRNIYFGIERVCICPGIFLKEEEEEEMRSSRCCCPCRNDSSSEKSDDEEESRKRRCCKGRRKDVVSLTHGGFYFGRFFVLGGVGLLLLVSAGLDLLNILRVPYSQRQAKRSAYGLLELGDMTADLLTLTREYLGIYSDIVRRESKVRCSANHYYTALKELGHNCTPYSLRHYKAAIDGIWNASDLFVTSIVAREISCHSERPFWSSQSTGFLFTDTACRALCSVDIDLSSGMHHLESLSYDDFIQYATDTTQNLESLATLYQSFEDAMNNLARLSHLSSSHRTDDTYFDFHGQQAANTATRLSEALLCIDSLAATTLDLSLDYKLKDDCISFREFSAAHIIVWYAEITLEMMHTTVVSLRETAKFYIDFNEYILVVLWIIVLLLHLLTFLFLEYVVYAPNLAYDEYIAHLKQNIHKNVDRHLLARQRRRQYKRERRLAKARSNSKASYYTRFIQNFALASTRRILPECNATETSLRLAKATSKTTKSVSKHSLKAGLQSSTFACGVATDTSYLARFWFMYTVHDFLLLFLAFLLILNVLMLFIGDKRVCHFFYAANGYVYDYLEKFVRSAETSCFNDLLNQVGAGRSSDHANIRLPSKRVAVDRCNVKEGGDLITPTHHRVNSIFITIASFCGLLTQWILLHWLPTAMCFARPRPLRKRLKYLKQHVTTSVSSQSGYDSLDSDINSADESSSCSSSDDEIDNQAPSSLNREDGAIDSTTDHDQMIINTSKSSWRFGDLMPNTPSNNHADNRVAAPDHTNLE